VLLCPVQIAAGEAEAPTTGEGLSATVTVEVPLHPAADTPVTVYIVVVPGQTLTVVPVRLPGIHVYVEAPAAVRFVHCPLQTEPGAALAETEGLGLTVTVATADAVEPVGVVPVTVYVVVVVGLTVILEPEPPVLQVKVVPGVFEDAFRTADCPLQIAGLLTVTVVGLQR